MTKVISQSAHIEWSKHPELLKRVHTMREEGLPFPQIADIFKTDYDLDVHGDTVRSAYKRHREMIRRDLQKEQVDQPKGKCGGIVRVTKEVLEQMLELPEGVHIQHLEFDHMRGIGEFLLKDETKQYLPEVLEAQRPMQVTLDFTK